MICPWRTHLSLPREQVLRQAARSLTCMLFLRGSCFAQLQVPTTFVFNESTKQPMNEH